MDVRLVGKCINEIIESVDKFYLGIAALVSRLIYIATLLVVLIAIWQQEQLSHEENLLQFLGQNR